MRAKWATNMHAVSAFNLLAAKRFLLRAGANLAYALIYAVLVATLAFAPMVPMNAPVWAADGDDGAIQIAPNASSASGSRAANAGGGTAGASLNLRNADLRTFISTVSRATGRNFLIDPRVNGSITVIISTPLDADALYQVFLSILHVHGFVAVEGENLTKILPANQSKSAAYVSSEFPESMVTTIIPIEHINAAQIIPVLRPFVDPTSFIAAYAPTNVLIIHDTEANLQRLRELIRAADKPITNAFEIIPVRHANAVEVVKLVSSFIKADPQAPASQQSQVVADARTNRIIVLANATQRLKIRTLVQDLDVSDSKGNTQVIYLKYANATNMLPILQGVATSSAAPTEGQAAAGEISIVADEETNAIIITAPQTVIAEVRAIIRRLDIRRAQVLIEAIIAEVSTALSDIAGVQLVSNARIGANKDSALVGAINFDNSIPSLFNSAASGSGVALPQGASMVVGEIQDAGSNIGWGALINLLNSNGSTNILSAPSLMTLDNEEATILVGQEVPFITNTQLTATSGNPFQNFERRDVGLSLKVKPQINEGDAIKLDIEQEVSNVLASAQAVDTVTSKRSIKTSVLVNDGKTIVIGGLMDDQGSDNEFKVPILGDIPLLGFFFRYGASSGSKRNLMVFLKPTIIRTDDEATRLSVHKYNQLRIDQLRLLEGETASTESRGILPALDGANGTNVPFESSQGISGEGVEVLEFEAEVSAPPDADAALTTES